MEIKLNNISKRLFESVTKIEPGLGEMICYQLFDDKDNTITEKNIITDAQGFKGFLVPGIAAMAIMQTGLFSVVFTLIRFKVSGVLRRLNVTPIGSSHFIIGQMITRVILIIIQTYLIIMIGIIILGVSIGKGDPLVWIEI